MLFWNKLTEYKEIPEKIPEFPEIWHKSPEIPELSKWLGIAISSDSVSSSWLNIQLITEFRQRIMRSNSMQFWGINISWLNQSKQRVFKCSDRYHIILHKILGTFVKFPEIPEFFPEFLCTQLICFKTAFTALYSDKTCYLVYYSKSPNKFWNFWPIARLCNDMPLIILLFNNN